jgi:hypothetical protein
MYFATWRVGEYFWNIKGAQIALIRHTNLLASSIFIVRYIIAEKKPTV